MLIVFGSIGVDLVSGCTELPRPGETVVGHTFSQFSGGKGANQALAAARAGARVSMFGAVGRDANAGPATALLRAGGVDLSGAEALDAPTGVAMIFVSAAGQNCISVFAGANGLASSAHVPDGLLQPGNVVVAQHECPHEANMALMRRARAGGALGVLNAAPARPLSLDELRDIDILVVNESEAEALALQHGWPSAPEDFAKSAHAATGQTVVVTLGEAGVVAVRHGQCCRAAAPSVAVVDTTGAGDAFVGAFAAALGRGASFGESLLDGVAAGSLACTTAGAQVGLPHADAIASLARWLSVQAS